MQAVFCTPEANITFLPAPIPPVSLHCYPPLPSSSSYHVLPLGA